MSMVTLAQAKAQSRILQPTEDTWLQEKIDAAERYAQIFLNRNVYADQGALDAALATLTPVAAQALQDTYDAALAAASALKAGFAQDSATMLASQAFVDAQAAWDRVRCGMVVNPTFVHAIVMTVAFWWINRESILTDPGMTSVELPMGARALLDVDRRQMGA